LRSTNQVATLNSCGSVSDAFMAGSLSMLPCHLVAPPLLYRLSGGAA
jgi:hypothetical protein